MLRGRRLGEQRSLREFGPSSHDASKGLTPWAEVTARRREAHSSAKPTIASVKLAKVPCELESQGPKLREFTALLKGVELVR